MELATLTTSASMDSRDIAKLTGKRHDNVIRDIEDQLGQLDGGVLRFEGSYLSKQNKPMKCYLLPKRECLILASGYSVKLRAAIIDRWAELEEAGVPKSFAAALRLAAEQQELIEAQAVKLEAQAPAVAFVEKFVEAKQTQPLRSVAKVLQVPEKKFVVWLLREKVLYRLAGKLVPMQSYRDAGYFELKEFVAPHGYANFQMAFTIPGIRWISGLVEIAKERKEFA